MLMNFHVQTLCWEEVVFHCNKALERRRIEVCVCVCVLPQGLFRVNKDDVTNGVTK